jgi:hypothetical protein
VVPPASCGSSRKKGTRTDPFCDLNTAQLDTTNKLILAAAGDYPPTRVDRSHDVYGAAGAVIGESAPGICDALRITGGAGVVVRVSGFTIKGGVTVGGSATDARLTRDVVGPSKCVGVKSTMSNRVTIERSLVRENSEGGILLQDVSAYQVVNAFVVGNGTAGGAGTSFGGALLKPNGATGPFLFVNNTVADNFSKGSTRDEAGGVRCDASATITNSILWQNTPAKSPGGQTSPACGLSHSDVDAAAAPPGAGNLNQPPQFLGSTLDIPERYHLGQSSPCINKGTKTNGPAVDYDGDPRVGDPDIGADEVK